MSLLLPLAGIMLVPFAAAGFALIQQGLGRSRSAAHAMLSALCVISIAAICFVLVGAAFCGFPGGASHAFSVGGVRWDWIGAEHSLARGIGPGTDSAAALLCLQMFTVGLAALIPVSAGGDRWRLAAICASTAFTASFLYPLFAHWVWGGGWLSQLGATFGLVPFVDAGGAGVVQVMGGFSALSVAWILGARRGKYSRDGMAAAIPGHNIVQVISGCLLALVGWIGLETATAALLSGATAGQTVLVVMNTMLSASGGCLAAVATTQMRYRKPDTSLSANGWIAGLVAGSAAGANVAPIAAIVTGLIAGVLVTLLVEVFELRLQVDDPAGAVSVHAGAGLWGLFAAGLFAHASTASRGTQVLAQLIGIATLLGCMLPLILITHVVINRVVRYRVDADGDWQGMDIRELGAGAYPEFVVHADEFLPR